MRANLACLVAEFGGPLLHQRWRAVAEFDSLTRLLPFLLTAPVVVEAMLGLQQTTGQFEIINILQQRLKVLVRLAFRHGIS